MKNTVVFDEYLETEIKPTGLLKKYIELTEADVRQMLGQPMSAVKHCPGCLHHEGKEVFQKFGFPYHLCQNCQTLYISPRPTDENLNRYYLCADSRQFWRDKLSQVTHQKRKEKIIKPRCQWILDSTQEYLPQARSWVDLNTRQYGYLEEMSQTSFFQEKILLNSYLFSEHTALPKNVKTISCSWWKGDNAQQDLADVLSLFEVIDHVSDLEKLFGTIQQILKKNGLCFLTTILASGFDIQTLWENSQNLYPPDRLNVFTVEGLTALFQRYGFECLEFSTPGIFDVDIVAKAAQQDPDLNLPRFVRYLIEHRDEHMRREFQEFLQQHRLSSYGRILLRKK
jgi:hypothetical protein